MKARCLATCGAMIVLSCGGYLAPHAHLATAMATTQVAEELGATKLEHSAYHVKLAHAQIERAQELIRKGQHEKADYMTLRAYNDAELAIALVRESIARERAMRALDKEKAAEGAAR